VQLNRG